MKEQLEQRLKELKNEFQSGQKMSAELQTKEMNLRETLLRITGAIQVLEEELATASHADGNGKLRPAEVDPSTAATVPSNA